uniref:Uncharacterized protein n=1 Tax=Rhizophora mucronata TaxID=61149 RepID=A0A2P2PH28_RHIMU
MQKPFLLNLDRKILFSISTCFFSPGNFPNSNCTVFTVISCLSTLPTY